MDVLEKFIRKVAYKFPKGYPDINNPEDKALLFTLLEELKVPAIREAKANYTLLSPEAKEEAEHIASHFNLGTENLFKAGSKNRIGIITDTPRAEFFKELETLDYERDTSIPGSGSGGMRKGEIEVIHKPASAQAGGGHGKENEEIFRNTLTNLIEKAGGKATVILQSGETKITAEGVTAVVDNSKTKTGEYYKPDADLMAGEETILGVSIKKDGGARWESSKTRLKDIYDNFIRKASQGKIPNLKLVQRPDAKEGKYFMQTEDGRNYGKIVIDEFPDTYDQEFVFGKPENFPVIVAERSFTEKDFNLDGTTVKVNISKIYKTLEDVEAAGKTPVVVFSHHINKPYGIEIRVFPESATPKEGGRAVTMKINYNELT